MVLSVFDLFSVGIGPSSSHTVGPMRAARMFVAGLDRDGELQSVEQVTVELFGSLGATGHGHGSVAAVVLGLLGETPEDVDPDGAADTVQQARRFGELDLLRRRTIRFDPAADVVLHRRRSLPGHPNGMTFTAAGALGVVRARTYYSVGGGFVVGDGESGAGRVVAESTPVPHPFRTADELLAACSRTGLSISGVMLENERAWRDDAQIESGLMRLWRTMQECVERGCVRTGNLPGNLKVPRRAHALHQSLLSQEDDADPLRAMDWVNLYALAVNEENASGGRVVTAPTNGAAGIIPAVLHYYTRFVEGADDAGIIRFLLTGLPQMLGTRLS